MNIMAHPHELEGLYLGRAIAAAVNLLNPQKVHGETLIRDKLLVVEPSPLGYNAALLGAAALCFSS